MYSFYVTKCITGDYLGSYAMRRLIMKITEDDV